ncbi:MAG: hypothetical protein P1V51_21215 [Deltaproteobacteria bacterium]|nr:hypothetical protein [Deltaproteobacteria bacterium]
MRLASRILVAALLLAPGAVLGQAEGVAVETEELGEELLPPPPAVDEADRPEEEQREFIKGELTRVGASQLALARRRFGVLVGYELIEEVQEDGNVDGGHYLRLTPSVDLRSKDGKFSAGFGVPLRLLIYGPGGFDDAGQIRKKDWDEPSDFAQVIRYLTYGGKEQKFFLQISQLDAATLGHGPILRRYFANADMDSRRVGLAFDTYGRYAGFELHVADLVTPFELALQTESNVGLVTGGLVFVKPLAAFGDGVVARSLSIGVTWAGELNAPLQLSYDPIGRVVTEPGELKPEYVGGLVDLMGFDLELKVLKTRQADLKPFVDFSFRRDAFFAGQGGWGGTLGLLGRFNYEGKGEKKRIHALRGVFELRTHAGNYIPAYFDSFYEVEKFAYLQRPDGAGNLQWITKNAALDERDPAEMAYGLYFELSWAPQDLFALGTALELSTAERGNNFYLHLEVPAGRYFQFLVTYHKRGFADAASFFDFQADDNTLVAAVRVEVLPILWLNLRAYQAFQFNIADPTVKLFEPVRGFQFEVELGWELARRGS